MKIDLSKIRAKIAQLNGDNKSKNSSNVQQWKPNVGKYTVRCLHWPEGVAKDGEFALDLWFYYNISQKGPILAPEQYGKEDPVKELRTKLFKSGAASDKELAKKLFSRMRSYVPIVVLEGDGADPDKAIVWAFGSTIYQKLLNYFLNEKVGDYFDVKTGYNLTVTVSKVMGKQFNDTTVELDALSGRQPLADSDAKIAAIQATIPDISGMYKLKDYATIDKELSAYLSGNVEVDTKNDTAGTSKGHESSSKKNSLDDLDDLVSEVKKESQPAKKKPVEKKPVEKKVEPVVSDDDDDSSSTEDLDAAFSDLMDE